MKITRIFIGFLFLINPDIVTFDILPDLIGYLFILSGLSEISYVDEDLMSAAKRAKILLLVSTVKLLSSPAISFAGIQTNRLTGQLFFAVAEAALTYLFVSELFRGINSLAVRLDGGELLRDFDATRIFTHAFFLVKLGLGILPQFVILFYPDVDADPNEVPEYGFLLRDYTLLRNVALILCMILILAMGIYTAKILYRYLKQCRRDKAFSARVKALYDERVTKNENALTRIAVSRLCASFLAAVCFLPSLYLDQINILPRPIFFILFLVGLREAEKLVSVSRGLRYFGFASLFVSSASFVYRAVFALTAENTSSFIKEFPQRLPGLLLPLFDEALSFLAIFCMLSLIFKIAKQKAKMRYGVWMALLLIVSLLLCSLSFINYHFTQSPDLVPVGIWVSFLVFFILHKKTLDDIRGEINWRYM